jgi:hypothetical protein
VIDVAPGVDSICYACQASPEDRRKSKRDKGMQSASVAHGAPLDPLRIHRHLSDTPLDPDLALIVDAWDRLPAAVKAGIVAMVRAASK